MPPPAGRAVLDTCVLYPALIRDTLLYLAASGLYQPVWSTEILDELRRNLQQRRPQPRTDHLVHQMTTRFRDAEVDGYQHLTDHMTCDAKDRHVLALAVHADAATLVTLNLTDFPASATEPHTVEVLTPDEFGQYLFSIDPTTAVRALHQQAEVKKRPAMTLPDLLDHLKKPHAMPGFATAVCRHLALQGHY
jgi:predicted nucleic acid-binding protein